jgi:alpha-L-fucosidase
MRMTRRTALGALAAVIPAVHSRRGLAQTEGPVIAKGPFEGTRESLKGYQIPEWFRDAKFGIWAHWGPQSATENGDWYARNMYIESGTLWAPVQNGL